MGSGGSDGVFGFVHLRGWRRRLRTGKDPCSVIVFAVS